MHGMSSTLDAKRVSFSNHSHSYWIFLWPCLRVCARVDRFPCLCSICALVFFIPLRRRHFTIGTVKGLTTSKCESTKRVCVPIIYSVEFKYSFVLSLSHFNDTAWVRDREHQRHSEYSCLVFGLKDAALQRIHHRSLIALCSSISGWDPIFGIGNIDPKQLSTIAADLENTPMVDAVAIHKIHAQCRRAMTSKSRARQIKPRTLGKHAPRHNK